MHLFPELFSSLSLLFALSTPNFDNFTSRVSLEFMARSDTHWGFTSAGEGNNEQITCYNVKSAHVDPVKCKIRHLGTGI